MVDLTEARPLIRAELSVKSLDGGQQIAGSVDCASTLLDFVYKELVRRFTLLTMESKAITPIRLANGQRVTSSTFCEITFKVAKHEFKQTFNVLVT
jgi:methyl coenzyme M reductase subunit C